MQHCGRLLMVEFDVPALVSERSASALRSPERIEALLRAYERGAAEYLPSLSSSPAAPNTSAKPAAAVLSEKEAERVVDGFLVPMLLGCFHTMESGRVTNWEMPISAWQRELEHAGFRHVTARRVYRYWWADAYLIEAQGARGAPPLGARM
jgi:hypothetical protein